MKARFFRSKPKFLIVVATSLVCAIDNILLMQFALAQTQIQQIPVPDAPPTFESNDIPPTNYSTPPSPNQDYSELNIYRVDVNDTLSITVSEFAEFNVIGIIDGEGNLTIPILGRVRVKGLTLPEIETKISYQLGRRYLKREPQVIAAINVLRPVQITLLGEINKPGYYLITPNTPISNLLGLAGGTNKDADLRSIVLRRPMVDGTVLEKKIDLYSPLQNGGTQPNIVLQGGDTILVSKIDPDNARDYDRALIARSNLPKQTITVRVVAPAGTGTVLRNLTLPNSSNFLDVLAGLPTADASSINRQEIALIRFDPEARKVVTQMLNSNNAVNGEIAQNVMLQDGDVIIVSRSLIAEIFNGLSILTQPIRDIFGFQSFIRNLF
jgi:polysaccharide export outer membrane protein